jgi:hypothetical protein
MKRVFSNPVVAVLAGACLRLFFVLKFPAGSGDTIIYDQLASNWLGHASYAMDVAGQPLPVDIRMPGYPAFLAIIYALSGHSGEAARRAVLLAQVVIDLGSCALIGCLSALIAVLYNNQANRRRAFLVGLWLAALCPFTANYVAVPLTETWAIFFTTLATLLLVRLIAQASRMPSDGQVARSAPAFWILAAAAGFVIGLGTLFRPETPLLFMVAIAVLLFVFARRGEFRPMVLTVIVLSFSAAVPLVPWTIRNAITFHEFQPLTPQNTNLPGELVPKGFMAWERTWLYRVRDCYLVPWKLNGEAIRLEDIPPAAFDTPDERDRVGAVLETYNDDLTLTAEQDAVFAQLARERTARHPLRTTLWIPLRRAVRTWFTPRIELLPVSGNVFPLRYMWQEDRVDQSTTVLLFFLNILYVGLGMAGFFYFWKSPQMRPVLAFFLLFLLIRTAFLTTLETVEPRYVLVCFPMLFSLATPFFRLSPLVPNN